MRLSMIVLLVRVSRRSFSNGPSAKHRLTKPGSVCIIGGGIAGLQAARTMQRIGVPKIKIIERQGEFGGVWAANHYESAAIQGTLKQYQFGEYLYDEHLTSGRAQHRAKLTDFAPTAVLMDYIRGYAAKFGLEEYAAFNTKLERLSRSFDPITGVHLGWEVTTDRDREHFDFVIMATGMYSEPFTVFPEIAHIDAFRADGGVTVHSSEFAADDARFRGDRQLKCAVIGAAKSAYDIAMNLANFPDRFEKPVRMIQRRSEWLLPRRPFNLLSFEWVVFSKMAYFTMFPGYFGDESHRKFMEQPVVQFLLLKVLR